MIENAQEPNKTPESPFGAMAAGSFWTVKTFSTETPGASQHREVAFFFCPVGHPGGASDTGRAGNRLSLAGWERRAGWQTQTGQDPCSHWSEPNRYKGLHCPPEWPLLLKKAIRWGALESFIPLQSLSVGIQKVRLSVSVNLPFVSCLRIFTHWQKTTESRWSYCNSHWWQVTPCALSDPGNNKRNHMHCAFRWKSYPDRNHK